MLHEAIKVSIPFFLCFLFQLPLFAQTCSFSIRGLVEDENGERMVGATVVIESLQTGVVSDLEGNFSLEKLCPGNYNLKIQYLGYEDQHISLRVPSARTIVIKLKASVKVLHDIIIEGQHAQKHSLSQSLSILGEDQILSSKGKSIGEILQQIPGVQSIMTGGGIFKPVIHGLFGQRILILNNGLRQEGQQWGLDHAPEIDTYIASEIEVVKGSESVRYGADALGGAIMVNTKPLHYLSSIGAELNGGVSSINRGVAFSGMLEGGLTKHWAWRVQGTMKKGGDYRAPDYNLSNTAMEETDLSAALGYQEDGKEIEVYASTFTTTIGILRSAHVGNLTDLQESIVSQRPRYVAPFTYEIGFPRQKVAHHLLKVSSSMKLGEGKNIHAVYGLQINRREEFDVPGRSQTRPSLSLELISHSADLSFDHEKNSWSGSIGLTGTAKDNYNDWSGSLLPDYRQFNGGVFMIEKYKKKKLLLEGGFRFDTQHTQTWIYDHSTLIMPSYQFSYFAGSAGISLFLNKNAKFSSNISVANRPPHVSELFSKGLHHSAAAIENGLLVEEGVIIPELDQIKTETSHQWVNTFQYDKEGTSVELTMYANYFNDFIYLSPTGSQLTIRGYFPVFEYRQTNSILTGGDAFVSLPLSRHFFWTSKLAYVWAEDRETNSKLPFIPPGQIENSISYKKSTIGKWKNMFITLSCQNVFEQKRAPRTVFPNEVTEEISSTTFDFMAAPDAYMLFKIETGTVLALDNRELSITMGVDNLFNTSYRNYMNRLRYYADETGRNFTIRLNYKFHTHED
jgi:iron complex outermembrane recepter protein